MVKLKRLVVSTIEPSVGKEGQIEFSFADVYVCKDTIKGFAIVPNDPSIKDNWSTKEIKKYCIENNINVCTMLFKDFGEFPNIIVNDTVNNLIHLEYE